jgi:transcriptional regulator of arginine metabolism
MPQTSADKHRRQDEITSVLASSRIRTQDELRADLARRGILATQATLSRDLVDLGAAKERGVYRLPETEGQRPVLDVRPAVLAIDPCGPNLILVRTIPGQAQSVGVDIDAQKEPAIAGTVAGDDTLFVATRDLTQQGRALERLHARYGAAAPRP